MRVALTVLCPFRAVTSRSNWFLEVTFLARSWRPPRAILGAPPLQGGHGGAIQREGNSFITRNQSQRLPSLRTGTPVTPVCAADAHLQRRRRGGARRLRTSQGRSSPLRSQARRSCWSRRSRLALALTPDRDTGHTGACGFMRGRCASSEEAARRRATASAQPGAFSSSVPGMTQLLESSESPRKGATRTSPRQAERTQARTQARTGTGRADFDAPPGASRHSCEHAEVPE